jgi:hypothetical protein
VLPWARSFCPFRACGEEEENSSLFPLLSSQSFEEGDDFFEGLEFIAAVFYRRTHETIAWARVDEVIAVEQVLLVAEDDVVVGWGREIFLHPGLYLRHVFMVVGWRWGYDIYVVMLYQHLVSLVHRTGCLHVTVVQGIEVDVYDRALLAVLLVVNPADYRTEIVECYLVDKSVLAMEWDGERLTMTMLR